VAVDDLSRMALANKIPVTTDAPSAPGRSNVACGIYVHVPFCAHACDFCAFYQTEPRREDIDRFLDTIERETRLVEPPDRVDTAFWGGGTPGVLAARDLERLGRIQLERFGPPASEWTVELAPGSVKPDKLRVLRELGVTRISLGVQSLDEATLDALGRRHSVAQVMRAWEQIKAAGFASTSLDLIFAVPGQSLEAWSGDLRAAFALEPDHLSTYCLTFEEDTALFVRLSEGTVRRDIERERAFYEATWDQLEAAGFAQYEISNFARPGHRCRHNVNTWRMCEWIGLGPSAAGQHGGWRGANPADLSEWSAGVRAGRRAWTDRVRLTPGQMTEDALIFGLRMNDGVDLDEVERRFGTGALAGFRPALEALVRDGLAARAGAARIALTREGRLLADRIGAEFVGMAGEAVR
jgi:oxygen-independent coproporphyrinogen III oxidase